MAVAPLRERLGDALLAVFFVIHIPCTVLMDAQCLPWAASLVPEFARAALADHVEHNRDRLMTDCPAWFRALVTCELAFQLPFFFVAAYAFAAGKAWIRTPALVYGVHTATTLVPILGHILFDEDPAQGSAADRLKLSAIYAPWLLVPLILTARMLRPEPFRLQAAGGKPGKKRKAG